MHRLLLPLALLGCSETGLSSQTGPSIPDDEPAVPGLLVEPLQVDFGSVVLGETADALLTATNTGEAPLTLVEVAFDGVPGPFDLLALDGDTLEPGASAAFALSFRPQELSTEPSEARILVQSDAPDGGAVGVDLRGATLLPAFTLTPTAHDFGTVDVGTEVPLELTVTNTGEAPGSLAAATFTATSPELAATDLGGLDLGAVSLDPGESLPLQITYAPTDEPADEGSLVLTPDVPDHPELLATVQGAGFAPEREVEVFLTADDAWSGFIDGDPISGPNQSAWTRGDTITRTLPAGEHVIAIEARDVGSVISGFIAVVRVDGTIVSRTGEGDWVMTATTPAAGWQDVGFDDSAWSTAVVCANPGTWGTYWPKPFYDEGAEWVWWTARCGDLRKAWFRLTLEL